MRCVLFVKACKNPRPGLHTPQHPLRPGVSEVHTHPCPLSHSVLTVNMSIEWSALDRTPGHGMAACDAVRIESNCDSI